MRAIRFVGLFVVVIMLASMLAACGGGQQTPTAVPEQPTTAPEATMAPEATATTAPEQPEGKVKKIGLVTDVGRVNDRSFNQSAWEGAQQAAKALGLADADVKYIETQDAKDYADNIQQFIDNGYDTIVTVGFALGDATLKAAQANPDINFIGVDQFQAETLPNLTGLIFHEDQAGYLAGALAASLTESDKIAAVLGTDLVPPVVAFKEGYESGAKATKPGIDIISTYHPGEISQAFVDPEWGAATAKQALDQGADVVFGAGGQTGNGALQEVAVAAQGGKRAFCIGVDTDQWETVPAAHPCLVSSAMKLITPGVIELAQMANEGKFPGGNYFGATGLAPFHDFEDQIPADLKAMLDKLAADLKSGAVTTGYNPGGTTTTEPTSSATKVAAANCDYGGEFLSIEAVDDLTVKFSLCAPDVAFPSKVAFSAFAIHSSDYLSKTGGTGDLLTKPIGTGPYLLKDWVQGDSIVMEANPDYWGDKAKSQELVFKWQKEGAARLLELQAGTVDGIDNPTPDDFAVIEGDSALKLYPREALNTFYLGLSNMQAPFDNEKVRQAIAMGVDRQRIVDNFYPKGSIVATHFTPCAIPGGCEGDEWYEFDVAAAKALLKEAGFENGFKTTLSYRDVVRGYLPQPALVAQDIQAQLKENLNIDVEINVMESGAFLDTAKTGALPMFLLGWGADYPDATNFLDYHFGETAPTNFGNGFPDIWAVLKQAASLADQAERNKLYAEANNLIKEHVPMVPVAHGGSATAFKADVEGAHSSPLSNENFSVMTPGDRSQLVWMQNAEPISLFCADEEDGESLRACEQINESLLSYQIGGTAVQPGLAEACTPNTDLTEWTCKLRSGVKFHDGSDLDATDVVASYALQWDAANPLHKGRTGTFTYFNALFGNFLNAPPAQ